MHINEGDNSLKGNQRVIEDALSQQTMKMTFTTKPVVVGGLAMEYYGLRQRGSDIDFIITNEDYQLLLKKYPNHRKDVWGDVGFLVEEYEMFRSIYKLDHDFFSEDAIEYDTYQVVSFEKLFLMKVLAKDTHEKHKRDLDLIIQAYLKRQNPIYVKDMEDHIEKYLAVPDGIIYNDGE